MKCSFCEYESKSQGIKNHERWCSKNPNKPRSREEYFLSFPNSKVFVKSSTFPRHRIKERILKQKLIKYECDICDLGPLWQNKPMPLILDHKNGKNDDNRLSNLRFVCSNCDTQLPTYKSKNIRKVK